VISAHLALGDFIPVLWVEILGEHVVSLAIILTTEPQKKIHAGRLAGFVFHRIAGSGVGLCENVTG
jgi:hypothetical protein